MPDSRKHILYFFLLLFGLLPFNQHASPTKQNQLTGRHFAETKIEDFRQDRNFHYGINHYRKNTISNKIQHFLHQVANKLFSDKGAAPYIRSLILLAILLFVVVKLFEGQFQWFISKDSKNNIGKTILPDQEINQVNLQKLANKAMQEGNLRLSVRYHYLHILQELNKNEFIHWHKDKTNRDYLKEIESPSVRSQFKLQTVIFDYVWYGSFELTTEQYERINKGFQNLITSIKKRSMDE